MSHANTAKRLLHFRKTSDDRVLSAILQRCGVIKSTVTKHPLYCLAVNHLVYMYSVYNAYRTTRRQRIFKNHGIASLYFICTLNLKKY